MVRFSLNQMRWLPIREDFQCISPAMAPPAAPCSKAAEQVDLKDTREWFNDPHKERDPVNMVGFEKVGDVVVMFY